MNRFRSIFHPSGAKRDVTAFLFLVRIAGMFIALASNVFLARVLGPANFGIFVYAVAVATVVGMIANAGLPTLITRETAKHIAQSNFGLARGVTRWAIGFIGIITAVSAVLTCVVWFGLNPFPSTWMVMLTFALVPLIALLNISGGVLSGYKRVVLGTLPAQILRPAIALLLYALLSTVVVLSAENVLAAFVVATTFVVVLGYVFVRRTIPNDVKIAQPEVTSKVWLMALLPLTAIAATATFKHQTDIIMLGFLATAGDVGIYRIASQIALIPGIFMVVLNTLYAPHIAAAFAAGDQGPMMRDLVRSARVMFGAAVAFLILMVIFGQDLVTFAFGPDFDDAYIYSIALTFGVLISAWCGQTAVTLKMTDHAGLALRASVESAVINVILNVIFILTMGPIGAAVATTIALGWLQFRQLRAIRKTLGISIHAFAPTQQASHEQT